jgi:hypothetical protein
MTAACRERLSASELPAGYADTRNMHGGFRFSSSLAEGSSHHECATSEGQQGSRTVTATIERVRGDWFPAVTTLQVLLRR